MEIIKKKNLILASKKANDFLDKYLTEKDEKFLDLAFEQDNTNSKILYYFLKNLKNKNDIEYEEKAHKFKLFLRKEDSDKLKIPYIDHKDDVLKILDSIRKIDPKNLLDISPLKESLLKLYPIRDKEIIESVGKKRINNLPLNLNDDYIYYLIIKTYLGEHLYPFINFKIENEIEKEWLKESLSYLKTFTEILIYYINEGKRELVYSLVNTVKFSGICRDSNNKLLFYLKKMNVNLEEISKKTGYIFKIKNYMPEIFEFKDKHKKLFKNLIEEILKSKCIQELIENLKEHHNDYEDIIKIDDDYIDYIKNNIIFHKFYDFNNFGISNVNEGKVIINFQTRELNLVDEGQYLLFNFCILIITGIHELIGHFLKDYFYYLTEFYISDESPIKKVNDLQDEEQDETEEGGFLVEKLLFGNMESIYICDVLYILDINNWQKSLKDFSEFFNSEERKKLIHSNKKLPKISEDFSLFLSEFNTNLNLLNYIPRNVSLSCRKKKDSKPYIKLNKKCTHHQKRKDLFVSKFQ